MPYYNYHCNIKKKIKEILNRSTNIIEIDETIEKVKNDVMPVYELS